LPGGSREAIGAILSTIGVLMLKRRLVATVGTIALALGIVLAASSAQAADRASPNSNTAMTESSVGILGCQETTATLRYNDGTSQGWYCSGTYRPKNAYVEKFSAGGWSGYLIQKYKNSSLRVDFATGPSGVMSMVGRSPRSTCLKKRPRGVSSQIARRSPS
jgi:uncharacterized membrane protein